MKAELTAIVVGGMLKPDEQLSFPDQTRVRLTIETIGHKPDAPLAWDAIKPGFDSGPSIVAASTSRGTNSMNAVDTNVFVYAFDSDEPVKRAKAHELLDRLTQQPAETVLLWQAASEFLNCLRKWESAGRMSSEDVEANFRDVVAMFTLRLPSAASFEISFDLRSRYSLSHWDSMLVAGCKEAVVDLLFTEDLDSGTNYDGVRIVNPFA